MNRREEGVVLVQVLGIVAFASAIAVMMLVLQDRAISVTSKVHDRSQAQALALGGETSVLVAFRRDAAISPELDHYGEEWFARSQAPVELEAGAFSVTVRDAQAKFNLNRLNGGIAEIAAFDRIVAASGLEPGISDRIQAGIVLQGELGNLDGLAAFGLSPAEIETLSGMVTVLPARASVNLNTADPSLIRALLANQASASRLIARREQDGAITDGTLGQLSIILPVGTSLRTDFLDVDVDVSVGDARIRLQSLIARTPRGGRSSAYVVRRDLAQK